MPRRQGHHGFATHYAPDPHPGEVRRTACGLVVLPSSVLMYEPKLANFRKVIASCKKCARVIKSWGG